jgi:hypothetical protein
MKRSRACDHCVEHDGIVNLLSDLSGARMVCHTHPMSPPLTNRYKNHRFPAEIISHGVWLYYREIVNGDIGLVPLFCAFENVATRKHVQGYVSYPDGIPVLSKLSLE